MPKSEVYPVKLSQAQRTSLTICTRIRNNLKERLKEVGDGTQLVSFTRRELEKIYEEVDFSAVYAPPPHKRRLIEVLHKLGDLLESTDANRPDTGLRKTAPRTGTVVFQFKITLREVSPPVWRRIQITDCTLAELHEYIQAAFGWEDSHLHDFTIEGERFGQIPLDYAEYEEDLIDETRVLVSRCVPKSGRKTRWMYTYDYGDNWQHEVVFEGFPPFDPEQQYPVCLEGARACPPEDCGGPWGYPDYLAAITDPTHEQHEDLLAWRGPFDPEAFDARQATLEMRKLR
ncbi:MAG: hypothetical protein KDA68_20900 [Planctomycetaceae bacterium]|nr:hypothetical protein [Planctomycetaceae bacterium]MCA9098212.1 hypothetical protein [Planctomycetaceae bacterium]